MDAATDKDPPTVTIIIRAFNEERYIPLLLKSIAEQKTSFNFETILVDSGSTDKTVQIAKSYNLKIYHISKEIFSFGRSLNLGISNSTGKICVAISAHCWPTSSSWLESLCEPILQNPKVAICYGKQRGIPESRYSESLLFHSTYPDHSQEQENDPFCNNANCAIQKSLWASVGGYNEELSGLEDIDIGVKALKLNYIIAYRAGAAVFHAHNETNRQVFNRYFREAIAYKHIFPNERFRGRDFVFAFLYNFCRDLLKASAQGHWLRALDIFSFRFNQFYGTWSGHKNIRISKTMANRLYYPSKQ